jgi:hypothetical protein
VFSLSVTGTPDARTTSVDGHVPEAVDHRNLAKGRPLVAFEKMGEGVSAVHPSAH